MQQHYRLIIIGAGFGGLGMAIRLRGAGYRNFLVLEKAAGPGGVWRDNTYPGAGCDIPSHLYCYSFERHFDWSRRFPPQEEILRYLHHCMNKYQVREHIRFRREVRAARFDETSGCWHIETQSGERLSATVLISATGQLNRPARPPVPGLEEFRGHSFHSARWDHDHDLRGRRVAVVGTGASAIQLVPRVAEQAERLFLLQRSPPHVIPRPDRVWHGWQRALMKRFGLLQTLDRVHLYLMFESRVPGFTLLPSLMKLMAWRFRRHLRRQVPDPALRERLTPDYPMGCKRILLSDDYYPALTRENVEVLPSGLKAVRARGIVTDDGHERAVDTLIFATGFRATEFLSPIEITGRNGVTLNGLWRNGAEAYKGITVNGFPNLFLLYGPNTNLGHNSIIYMIESQIRYVLGCLEWLERDEVRWIDVRADRQQAFNQWLQERMARTVWQHGCTSWYQTASGRNTNNWPGSTLTYRLMTRKPDPKDYEMAMTPDTEP